MTSVRIIATVSAETESVTDSGCVSAALMDSMEINARRRAILL